MSNLVSDEHPTTRSNPNFATLAWNQIHAPGTYVCNWSGHLLRVPAGSVPAADTPSFNLVGTDPLFVTQISDDPELSMQKARQTATDLDLAVGF